MEARTLPRGIKVTGNELRAFLDLLMCSDPSPLPAADDRALRDFADRQSRLLGFDDWVDAFHRHVRQDCRPPSEEAAKEEP